MYKEELSYLEERAIEREEEILTEQLNNGAITEHEYSEAMKNLHSEASRG